MTAQAMIHLGISTCPNDTFAFHGLLTHAVDWRGLDFDVELLDIQQLNEQLFRGKFDVAKASFHAALYLANDYVVLESGSALGFGVGPLLLASRRQTYPELGVKQLTLCPGEHTTATLLLRLFYPGRTRVEQTIFSDIMPRLTTGTADFGVCIHEGRFTWQAQGLALVEDLGVRWENETGCPLPLGGILAKKSLSEDVMRRVQEVVLDSLDFSLANPEQALPTMRKYAQEFGDEVLVQHVELYVNQWTRKLGTEGERALAELSRRAVLANILAQDEKLEIANFD